jgi:hypothetical protein
MNISELHKEQQLEFGSWILGEIWHRRLVACSNSWYRNGRKVSIIHLHKMWKKQMRSERTVN